MARLREDPRFRAVQPDVFEGEQAGTIQPKSETNEIDEGLELWFDWAFVDFWKNHYCKRPWYGGKLISQIRFSDQ